MQMHHQRFRVLALCAFITLTISAAHGKGSRAGAGVSADVARPYAQVLPVVQEIAQDGLIRGTSEYRGTDQLDGAVLSEKAIGFSAWKGPGQAFYKVRTDALAPTHFRDSGDKGTVVVRYIVEPVTADSSRITIEAVFDEDSHHRSHPSEGLVESSEFVAISEKFRQMDLADNRRREEAEQQVRHKQLVELQEADRREQEQLDSVKKNVSQLEQKLAALEKGRTFKVRTTTDLKAEPFSAAKAVSSLKVGDAVLVLLETKNWCKIQVGSGEQGWVYRPMLEVSQ